jgi:cell division protein FtsW
MATKTSSTVSDRDAPAASPRVDADPRVPGPLAALRGLLERPLASYYLLLACVGLLLVFGLVMVFSATSVEDFQASHDAYASIVTQAISALVGLLAFWVCQRLPVRTYRAVSRVLLVTCVLLMVVTDALGFVSALRAGPDGQSVPVRIGPIHANQLWLYLGSFQLQPAELVKLGLVLWAADVLVRKGAKIVNWRELLTPLFPVALILFALVGVNDFGTMTCLFVLLVGVLWAAGVRLRVFAALFAAAAVGMAGLIALLPYRRERLTVFLDPSHAAKDGPAYQFFQGLYAIAHGGWFGVGLGQGAFKWGWLPEAHNDFIFAVIAEELGLIGVVAVIGGFLILTYCGVQVALAARDRFGQLLAGGIVTWLVVQTVINVGGVTGLMPVTGLTLPFFSAGGSSLFVSMAASGLLLNIARHAK